MATYVIGDVQGCFEPLQRLLALVHFDPTRDRVWLVGDLVNRGPDSLAVLRWARGLGDACVAVLGNHDLHLLGVAAGLRRPKKRDTLAPVLAAPDGPGLCDWLASRPLLVREGPFVMTHAGLHPAWTDDEAEACARELEHALAPARRHETLAALAHDDHEVRWPTGATGAPRLRAIAAVLTRMRLVDASGRLELAYSDSPDGGPAGYEPWFRLPSRRAPGTVAVFGHWAALGLVNEPTLIALDTGCVWGNRLTAMRLGDRRVFSVPAKGQASSSSG